MKFTVPQKELAAALTRCAAIAPGKSSMPILSSCLLDPLASILRICATDLEVGYTTAVGGLIWDDGTDMAPFLLNAKTLAECIKSIPVGEVTIQVKDCVAIISGGTVSFTLSGLDATDFPDKSLAQGSAITIDHRGLVKALRNVSYCQARDETKPHLAGCYLQLEHNDDGDLFAVTTATDGHRLCLDTEALTNWEDENGVYPVDELIPAALIKGVIIPAKGVAELVKLAGEGPAVLGIVGNSLTVSLGDEVLTIQLAEGDYPDTARIVPKNPQHTIQVKRQGLIDALERCRIITNKDTRGVDLSAVESVLGIASALPAIGAEAIDHVTAEIEGQPPLLCLNIDYLLQTLANLSTASVEIRITDELKPVIVNPIGTDFPQAIIMPMRGV